MSRRIKCSRCGNSPIGIAGFLKHRIYCREESKMNATAIGIIIGWAIMMIGIIVGFIIGIIVSNLPGRP